MDILAAIGSVNTKIAGIEGRLVAGDASLADLKNKLDSRPCLSERPCPTQQVPLPPASPPPAPLQNTDGSADAIKTFLAMWNTLPHAYRICVVASIGGVGAVQAQHILDWIARLSQ
jgi:hypothetical protein